jgi:transcriptional regulator with XRE-family HTH domain
MNNENQNYIGTAIQYHRHLKGLSQDQLARLSDVSYNTIVKLERKSVLANPTITTLQKIAEVLDVPIVELVTNLQTK